jgi:FYVE, RhoGEF and PH domain containing 5/6
MCGYLKRKTKASRSWKRMWYVLKDKVVYVYKAPEDNVAVESFPVLGYGLDAAPFDVSLAVLTEDTCQCR